MSEGGTGPAASARRHYLAGLPGRWRHRLSWCLAGDLGERTVVDALWYLAAAKARTVVQGRLRGL